MKNSRPTKTAPFIRLPHSVYDANEFKSLEPIDVLALLALIRKFNGKNNGGISLGVREAAARCRCHPSTVSRALKRLVQAGFISCVNKGRLVPEPGRPNVASHWRLNFIDQKESE